MKISARNRLDGIVDKGRRRPRERQDQGWRRNHTAAITDETVEQLKSAVKNPISDEFGLGG
jgi:molybdopterin-binding protein